MSTTSIQGEFHYSGYCLIFAGTRQKGDKKRPFTFRVDDNGNYTIIDKRKLPSVTRTVNRDNVKVWSLDNHPQPTIDVLWQTNGKAEILSLGSNQSFKTVERWYRRITEHQHSPYGQLPTHVRYANLPQAQL